MNAVKKLRSDIMEILFSIEDIEVLKTIRFQIKTIENPKEQSESPNFLEAVKPIQENISLEELMLKQNYQPITYKEFRQDAQQIEWKESLDELLTALKK